MRVETIASLNSIAPDAWDSLVSKNDPFSEYAFLSALERSESVGEEAGAVPVHLVVYEGNALVGALPLYAKTHSYGEYIFDWGWASAAHRHGLRYYPKLVSMIPFTPATTPRALIREGIPKEPVIAALREGLFAVAEEINASSIHLLFLSEEESALFCSDGRFMPRHSLQFHWTEAGDRSFDEYLARMRSGPRKTIRKERRRANEAAEVTLLEGEQITDEVWATVRRFYLDTCAKKGAIPYLSKQFFDEPLPRALVSLAKIDGEPVASALSFAKGERIYGRYWGCAPDAPPMLHFECCYYRLIERAIETGVKRFEAGAQGHHKMKRGLLPTTIHSAHWLANPGLQEAVGDFLPRESQAVQSEIEMLMRESPFRGDS